MRTALAFFVAAGLVAGGAVFHSHKTDDRPTFRTAKVSRGDLRWTIAAIGTVEPEEVVDIGAQVGGLVKTLGIDPSDPNKKKLIDFGSIVHKGTVLATIDDAPFKAQVDNAEATIQRAQADLDQSQARLDQAAEELRRAKSLVPTYAIAQSEYDTITANYRAALAAVAAQKATFRQNEVMLRLAKTSLDNTIIRSPVHGVILDRRANVGQTVVASFNAPSLFLIAKDLRRMQIWASVNESDIGQVRTGMPVKFTVDTYPDEAFQGQVAQIRLKAVTTAAAAVVYTVVILVDNSNGKLLPSLTANLQFEVGQRKGVLMVPSAALSWQPRPEQMSPNLLDADLPLPFNEEGEKDRSSLTKPTDDASPSKSAKGRDERGCLWVQEGEEFVRSVEVRTGVSDGSMTEVSGQQVKEGMEVVVGQSITAADSAPKAAEDRGSPSADVPQNGQKNHRNRH